MKPLRILALVTAMLGLAAPAGAQSPPADPGSEPPIDDLVAQALVARGKTLFEAGDYEHAKRLFVEALQRSPSGPSSTEALAMLRSSNEKLGIADRDAGRPGTTDEPIDPYGGGKPSGDDPIDPYGKPGGDQAGDQTDKPGDQTGEAGPVDAGPDTDEPNTETSRGLMAWGAGYGFMLGMAIGGPENDTGEVSGAAVALGLLGLGAGLGGGYLTSRRVPMSRGQVTAITSAGTWAGLNAAFVGDLVTDTGTDTNDIYASLAIGGALGAAGGAVYARLADIDEGDIAFTNSLGAYGLASGLLFGVAISPPRSEAYSINGMVGSLGGIAGGFLLADRFDMSRRRTLWIDGGAAVGVAATWGLLYPLVRDETTNNDEQFAGAFSVLTMWGGIAAAYYFTRGLDEAPAGSADSAEDSVARRYPAPPGLVQRAASGRWSLGSPMVRPLGDPALAPPSGLALGLDLASGRF